MLRSVHQEKSKIKKKKICFVMGVGQREKLMYLIAEEMIRRFDIEPRYLVSNNKIFHYLKGKNIIPDKIIRLYEKTSFGSWVKDPIDYAFLEKMEHRYGIPNLYLYWEGVRSYKGYDHYNQMKMLEIIFREYLDFIEKENFDFALLPVFPASLPILVMSRILELKGTPFYFMIPSRIENRFLIVRGVDDKYHRIDAIFDRLKQRDLTEKERDSAERFISKYHQSKRYFSTSEKLIYHKKDISLARLNRGISSIIDSYRYGTLKRSYRKYSFWAPLHETVQKIMKLIRKQYLRRNNLFQSPVESEKYVLFLLHKEPEASTFFKSPFFVDQRYLIEIIAKSLPIGYLVYVKPHHNDFGDKPLSYFKKMICRPNIRMLMMNLNSQELVKKSAAVITISGTVGWEGIILGKPVITFGRVFYNHFDQVMHVRDVTELPYILRKAIFDYKADSELMLKYVYAHILETYEGNPLSPIYTNNASLEKGNITKIVDGISRELDLE